VLVLSALASNQSATLTRDEDDVDPLPGDFTAKLSAPAKAG
jgi:hypothetical protein